MRLFMTSKNKKLTGLFVGGCLGVLVVAAGSWVAAKGNFGASDQFCQGVTISGMDMGGLTKPEGQKKVTEFVEALNARQVTIAVEKNKVTAEASALGFSCKSSQVEKVVEKAYMLGKTGNIFSRFQKIDEKDKKKGAFELDYKMDEKVLKKFLKEHCTKFDVKAKNAKLKRKNGVFTATKSRKGRELQMEESVAVVSHGLLNGVSGEPIEISAVVSVTEPEYTKKQVEKCKDLIGRYSTSYATSNSARATNVKTAANYIDGTIIYPGKTFSTIKTIKDRTEENGYKPASEYSSGKVVEGIGGGVCQVSTTLYNAIINAELEIVERSPHSMVVSYVDVSRDAAISGNYKDFKFKNNTDVPIYISATADGATLSFSIYGQETRESNRNIKFKSEILETIQPGNPVETVDASKPASYRMVTQSAHVGYKAKLWKLIYVDGKRTEKVLVNSSSYAAEPEYITVGKKQNATSKPAASKTPKPSGSPKPTKKPKDTKVPEVTAEPKSTATAAPKATEPAAD